jgi:hypothetical protein
MDLYDDDDRPEGEGADQAEQKGVSWGLERRLQFIDFRLRWEGRFNRDDLRRHFGLSTPQVSLDISKYAMRAPDNLTYDRSSKTYVSTDRYEPVFPIRSSARRYMAELLATKTGLLEPGASFIGMAPEVDTAPSPWRTLNETTVAMLVKAIRDKLSVIVRYQSMTSLEESKRKLSPHAFGYDGFRWHVRAYCHKRERFSDFVLARILGIDGYEQGAADSGRDDQWHTVLTLILGPHPDLSPAKTRVMELDYGMQDGEVQLPCRQAFLYYTLRRLGLQSSEAPDPIVQQIVLKNRTEIQPFIDAVSGQS